MGFFFIVLFVICHLSFVPPSSGSEVPVEGRSIRVNRFFVSQSDLGAAAVAPTEWNRPPVPPSQPLPIINYQLSIINYQLSIIMQISAQPSGSIQEMLAIQSDYSPETD